MKIKKMTKLSVCTVFMFLMLMVTSITYGASFQIGASTALTTGNTTTLTINSYGLAGRYDIVSSNPSVVNISNSSIWIEDNVSSITLTAVGAGSADITVTPTDVSDVNTFEPYTGGSQSITIFVSDPAPAPEPTPEPTPDPPSNSNNNNNNNNSVTLNSNTYLSYLVLSEEGMTPRFVREKTSYAITVGMDVTDIQVSAAPEASTSYVAIYGNTNLQEGDNTITIVVTAQDGSTRTYYVTVTKTADPEKANAYLENLVIENITLTPEFQSEVFEYDLGEVPFDTTKLAILTFTKNENATVEITGNEELKVGENEIKITVTAQDGTTKKEYILKVNRLEETEDVLAEQNALKDVSERSATKKLTDFLGNLWLSVKANALLVIMYIFIVVEFSQVAYLYKKLNRAEEILEKYGIDEEGNMKKTRSGKKRDIPNAKENPKEKETDKKSMYNIALEDETKTKNEKEEKDK